MPKAGFSRPASDEKAGFSRPASLVAAIFALFPPMNMIERTQARERDGYLRGASRRGAVKGLRPRPITVDGVGNENAGAHDAEKRGDCFQHGDDPKMPSART
jgi:hypothetical protein